MIDLSYRWLYDLGDFGHDGAFRNFADGLADDVQGLPHFGHAHQVPVVGIAVLANGNFEIEIRVGGIGLRLTDIPAHTAGPQHRAGDTQRNALLAGYLADIFGSLHPDAVGGEQFFVFIYLRSYEIKEVSNIFLEAVVSFVEAAADAERVRGQTSAAILLEDFENLFPVAESVEERSDGTDIEGVGSQPKHMAGQPV